MLSMAFSNTSIGGVSLIFWPMISIAPYTMPCAANFLPPVIKQLMTLLTSLLLYTGSGTSVSADAVNFLNAIFSFPSGRQRSARCVYPISVVSHRTCCDSVYAFRRPGCPAYHALCDTGRPEGREPYHREPERYCVPGGYDRYQGYRR